MKKRLNQKVASWAINTPLPSLKNYIVTNLELFEFRDKALAKCLEESKVGINFEGTAHALIAGAKLSDLVKEYVYSKFEPLLDEHFLIVEFNPNNETYIVNTKP